MQHPNVQGSQVYPMPSGDDNSKMNNICENPEFEPERQIFGYILLVILSSLVALYGVMFLVGVVHGNKKLLYALMVSFFFFQLYFFVMALHYPEYLGGKPETSKSWPMFVAWTCFLCASIYRKPENFLEAIVTGLIVSGAQYFIMFQDDSSDSCCLCFKPWVYKRKPAVPVQPCEQINNPYTNDNYYSNNLSNPYQSGSCQPNNPYQPEPHQAVPIPILLPVN